MSFERLFTRDIPLHEAAAFFVGIKKFAAATDPPDETGELEGMFPVPVEQVILVMGEQAKKEFESAYAYHVYAQTVRDLSHDTLAEHFQEHAADELDHFDFLVKRMTVLAGPVHAPELEAPHPSSDPVDIIKTLIRMEQEGIAGWRKLLSVVGDNPMKVTIEDYAAKEQEHLDDLWQLLPDECKVGTEPGQPPMGLAPNGPPMPAEAGPPAVDASAAPPEVKAAAMRMKLAMAKQAIRVAGVYAISPEQQREMYGNMVSSYGNWGGMGSYPAFGVPGMSGGLRAGDMALMHEVGRHKHAAANMRFQKALLKMAQGEGGLGGDASSQMASPTAGELEATNYLQAEMAGRKAQEQNESSFYREQLGQAQQSATAAQQQASDAQMQLQQLQQQAQEAGAQIQAAMQKAVAAQDAATQQTLEAAKSRIGAQELRAKMLEIASQDPAALGEQALAPPPPAPGMEQNLAPPGAAGAEAPTAGAPSPEEGGAGQAGGPQTPPGATPAGPPTGGGPSSMGEAAPQPPGTEPTGGAENANNVKMSSAWQHAALGAAVGGGLGAAGSLMHGGKVQELQSQLQQAEAAAQDGSYGSAARLASLKAGLATAQLAQQHPGMAALSSAVPGAIAGGLFGPTLIAKAKRAKGNIIDALR